MSLLPGVIPLFPLGEVVHFPKVALPLHIFEPRYRKMVKDALQGDRIIGMTLLQAGYERAYNGRPPIFSLGCAGRITESAMLPDGRYNIMLRGLARFHVREERPGEPYRFAIVDELSDQLGDASTLEGARERILSAVSAGSPGPTLLVVQPEVSDELFINTLCQMLPFDVVEKLALLECDTLSERCQRLLELLDFRRLNTAWSSRRTVRPN